LSPDESLVAGTIAFGAIHGAIESWMHHDAGRSKLENMVVRMLLAAGPI
jgi:hypothetical protein